MSLDDIDRWVDEVEEAKRRTHFPLNAVPPKTRDIPPRRASAVLKKRSRDDAFMEESGPPSKKPSSTAASKQSSSTVGSPFQLKSAGITVATLDPAQLPADSHPLYQSISDTSSGLNTIPVAVRSHIFTSFDRVLDPQLLRNYHLPNEAAVRELELLREVVSEASRCSREKAHEADWNCTVHSPLFNIAFKSLPPCRAEVRARHITNAAIIPEYLPCNLETDNPLQAHKVDFCLAFDADPTMERFVARQTPETINQTTYAPLNNRPIAVSIETKSESRHTTGIPQLATWTYAWLARMTQLAPNAPIPTLPLLQVVGHDWHVLWAWRDSDGPLRMTITSDLAFGHTRNLFGVYRILSVLRRLVLWVDEVFQPWAAETFK